MKFQFFIPELWDFIHQIVGDFSCRAVNWEPLGQFTSNFAQLLELIVLRSVYFLVKFRFFIQELWERKSLQILYECWRRAYHALLAQLFIQLWNHSWWEQVVFDAVMMRSALYWTNTLSWIFTVLDHWSNSPRVDMSLHSDTLSLFWANQSLLLHLNDVWLV